MTPAEVVDKMMASDYFSQWLGIKVLEIREGYSKLSLVVRKDMLNGFGIAHGGITYCISDSALAFASNSKGIKSVSIETSIAHVTALKENEKIIAECICETETEKLGHYRVTVFPATDPSKTIALFKGMVYKTGKSWE